MAFQAMDIYFAYIENINHLMFILNLFNFFICNNNVKVCIK